MTAKNEQKAQRNGTVRYGNGSNAGKWINCVCSNYLINECVARGATVTATTRCFEFGFCEQADWIAHVLRFTRESETVKNAPFQMFQASGEVSVLCTCFKRLVLWKNKNDHDSKHPNYHYRTNTYHHRSWKLCRRMYAVLVSS